MTAAEPGRVSAGPATGLRSAVGLSRSALLRSGSTVALLCAALLVQACATGWSREGERLVHRAQGLSIRMPEGEGWEPVDVDGTTLTLRRGDGAMLSWIRRCEETAPRSARAASQALLRSLVRPEVVSQGPVPVSGGEGWRVEARVRREGGESRIEAVTRLSGRCTEDWVLVAPASAVTLGVLDAWWPSVDAPQVAADGADPR